MRSRTWPAYPSSGFEISTPSRKRRCRCDRFGFRRWPADDCLFSCAAAHSLGKSKACVEVRAARILLSIWLRVLSSVSHTALSYRCGILLPPIALLSVGTRCRSLASAHMIQTAPYRCGVLYLASVGLGPHPAWPKWHGLLYMSLCGCIRLPGIG